MKIIKFFASLTFLLVISNTIQYVVTFVAIPHIRLPHIESQGAIQQGIGFGHDLIQLGLNLHKPMHLPEGCANRWCTICARGYYKQYHGIGWYHGRTNRCVSRCPEGTVPRGRSCVEAPPKGCADRYCTRCAQGYYKVGNHGYGSQHHQRRNRCVSQCPNGTVPRGRSCVEAPPKGCADRYCIRCAQGYYKVGNHGYSWQHHQRTNRCVSQCPNGTVPRGRSCVEEGCADRYCTRCAQGYYKVGNHGYNGNHQRTNRCVSQCPNGTVPRGRSCVERPPDGCTDRWCSRCTKGYYKLANRWPMRQQKLQQHQQQQLQQRWLVGRDKCVNKCPNGTVARGKNCVDLPNGCSNLRCTSCEDGYFFWPYSSMITWGTMGRCQQSCPREYVKNYKLNKCIRCQVSNCYQCGDDENMCEQCKYGYKLTKYESKTTCEHECPEGYKASIDESLIHVCKKSGITIVKKNETEIIKEGCVDRLCVTCKSGYYKFISIKTGSECVRKCPQGYYTSTADCIPCTDPRCSDCSNDPFKCSSCKSEFVVMAKEDNSSLDCLRQCPKDYTPVKVSNDTIRCEKVPEPKCSINNCKNCLQADFGNFHHGCADCDKGFYLKRNIFKDECIRNCPKGFYGGFKPGTEIAACLDCGVSFCKKCSSRKRCIECNPPFVVDFKKKICALCPFGTQFYAKTGKCKKTTANPTKPLPLFDIH